MSVTILLLAAGKSSRMQGEDKLSRKIDGESLLHRAARIACDSGLPVRVITTDDRRRLIADLDVNIVKGGPDMASSLQAGLRDLSTDAVIIALADMPDVTAKHYQMIAAHADHPIVRGTYNGIPGHPVLFDRRYFGELMQISGDIGPREVLKRHSDAIGYVELGGNAALTDLDTPEDWQKYRK